MKVFIHGRFLKKTFSVPKKWRVAPCPTAVVTALFAEEECLRMYKGMELAFSFFMVDLPVLGKGHIYSNMGYLGDFWE